MVSAAFVPATAVPAVRARAPAVSRRPVVVSRMSLSKRAARVAASVPAAFAAAAPALAEGTGEGLGIDNVLLYLPLILIPGAFLALFLQFDGSQDKEDFFGAYDERRN